MARQTAEQWDAGYPRVSTTMQVEREALQNQVQALEAYAKAHSLNLRLYPEEGVSAKDTDRPKLQELLADVRSGRVRSVVVTKLDRISRSLADLLDLMRLFEEHGVKFVSVRDNIDTSGPVGRFMLHILGAIAELERAITAERVAEDMKLRARRGKWNGGVAPYGREVIDGQLRVVPEEAALLHRMRLLLKERRSWRGVAITLNREGKRTRGWAAVERDGRVVRKGKPPAEWAPGTVRRVLLQPINVGDLVYNRRKAKGKTSAPRPADEHIVVPDFAEPIFSRDEMDEVLRIAAEIEGEPPARTGSEHVLSGLVYCRCGSRMHAVKNYITTKRRGRYPLVYFRCRRASHAGTCGMRQVPEAAIVPIVGQELAALALDKARLAALSGAANASHDSALAPLVERRAALARECGRLADRVGALLELAEDRLIGKPEFATRKARLETDHAAASRELDAVDAELAARSDSVGDIDASLRSLRCFGDVYDGLDEVAERRRLLTLCLARLVVGEASVEVHRRVAPTVVVRTESSQPGPPRRRTPARSHRLGPRSGDR